MDFSDMDDYEEEKDNKNETSTKAVKLKKKENKLIFKLVDNNKPVKSTKSTNSTSNKTSEDTVNTAETVEPENPYFPKDRINELIKGKKSINVFKSGSIENDDVAIALLLNENVIEYKCSKKSCRVKNSWLRNPIELILARINGKHNDMRIPNIELLCPNCYSQLENPSIKFNKIIKNKIVECIGCKTNVSRMGGIYLKYKMCKKCHNTKRGYTRNYAQEARNAHLLDDEPPSKEELQKEVNKSKLIEEKTTQYYERYNTVSSSDTISKPSRKHSSYKPKNNNTSTEVDDDDLIKMNIPNDDMFNNFYKSMDKMNDSKDKSSNEEDSE